MEGRRKALYSYSWQQSPINKHRRVNPPEEEKKIFDDWFEEKADEYFPWIRDQGFDDETIRANASCTLSSPPCNPEMCRAPVPVSSRILEQLQRPKQHQKILKEETCQDTGRLANIIRYERSLKETRKAIDKIKKEKQRKLLFPQTQKQRLSCSVLLPEHSVLSELSSFQKKLYKEKVITRMESRVSGSRQLEDKLKSGSILLRRRISCSCIEEDAEQTTSSKSKQQTSGNHNNDDSDNELLRLALESSPIQKSDSALRAASSENELSDEALLAMMISSPVPSRNLKNM
ncbi:hypothetical protein LOAG_17535 [Loa loa]|uniref:Uncharacterized protein n=1 Tax=Loa loa TaxID=7209 RepID=A0A1I7VQP3_LOALO|nr:hypothetical protein LOAG_17535 [Loa loa]EJD75292.1 hypothetical protein LOAG_17535 [Loa loa]